MQCFISEHFVCEDDYLRALFNNAKSACDSLDFCFSWLAFLQLWRCPGKSQLLFPKDVLLEEPRSLFAPEVLPCFLIRNRTSRYKPRLELMPLFLITLVVVSRPSRVMVCCNCNIKYLWREGGGERERERECVCVCVCVCVCLCALRDCIDCHQRACLLHLHYHELLSQETQHL
jgi:hypothetical protein